MADYSVGMMLYGLVIKSQNVWMKTKKLLVDDCKYNFKLGDPEAIARKPNEYFRPYASALGAAARESRKEPTAWEDVRAAREWLAYKVLSLANYLSQVLLAASAYIYIYTHRYVDMSISLTFPSDSP